MSEQLAGFMNGHGPHQGALARSEPGDELNGQPGDSAGDQTPRDDSVDQLAQLLNISLSRNSESSLSERKEQHAAFRRPLEHSVQESQRARREEALRLQKRQRYGQLVNLRKLAEIKTSESESESETSEEEAELHIDLSTTSKRRMSDRTDDIDLDRDDKGPKKLREIETHARKSHREHQKSLYANKIMYAEHLTEVPEDLDINWYIVPCPVGKRCMVISGNGRTIARARSGRVIKIFQSPLPSGSKLYRGGPNKCCVLDCIFDEQALTFYILDMMAWNGAEFWDCDSEFRFNWMQTQLDELPLSTPRNKAASSLHLYQFHPLNFYLAQRDTLQQTLLTQFHFRLDGFLFYDKRTQYVMGETPLVGWVQLDRLYELFGVTRDPSWDASNGAFDVSMKVE
ncbi:hypothetical protein BZG36_05498 [Bifiguratus adelaidae]|uniref:Snurportin-1 n=1 Tax=Bifiguratus adelaidae TaxID=1938954 RepID=A0A261XSX8_9FUNG|nr:hypothetical protein BZG36_05498 [Bifiguratus adelaidae]